jgi:hypothetical protein
VLISIIIDGPSDWLVVFPVPVVVTAGGFKEAANTVLIPVYKLAFVIVLAISLGDFVVEDGVLDFLNFD